MKKNVRFTGFVFVLIAVWIISDVFLTFTDPVSHSAYFPKNDFEITKMKHPEKVWDKVFYGSSVVVNSYIEEESRSGYYNLGISYGTVSDIYEMIEKKYITVGSELVIGLNDVTFVDWLDTNPTYPWHKKWYQHYVYFRRDNICPFLKDAFSNVMAKKNPFAEPLYTNPGKLYVYGALSDEELEKSNESMLERFGGCTVDKDCRKNFADLEKLIKICKKKNIRLRAVWMPWNPSVEVYDFAKQVQARANEIFDKNGIEVLDMTNAMAKECFYDIGHMDYGWGASQFTKKIEPFLTEGK